MSFGAHPTKIIPFFTMFVFGKQPTLKGDESEQSDDDGGEAEQLAAEEAAIKERKRAGLPEISPDTLNSSIANKMLTLSPRNPWVHRYTLE